MPPAVVYVHVSNGEMRKDMVARAIDLSKPSHQVIKQYLQKSKNIPRYNRFLKKWLDWMKPTDCSFDYLFKVNLFEYSDVSVEHDEPSVCGPLNILVAG